MKFAIPAGSSQSPAMKTLVLEYPEALETVLNTDEIGFAAEARMALAVKLYEMGRLSSGQAASLAGVNRVHFLLDCPRFGAPSVAWDDEELRVEFAGLEAKS
jgi:predicted HTH domain antitoxin